MIVNTIKNYSLKDYLFVSILTGQVANPNNLYLTEKGYLMDDKYIGKYDYMGYIDYNLIGAIMDVYTEKCYKFERILNNFKEVLSIDSFQDNYYPIICREHDFEFDKRINIEVKCLEIRSDANKYYLKLQEVKSIIDDDLTLQKGIIKLVEFIENGNINYRQKDGSVDIMRKVLGIPFIQVRNGYGQDFSLLDLSDKIFDGCEFKDYCFAGTNFRNTKFNKCKFSCSTFVGADLRGAKFTNCEFSYMQEFTGGPFYKTLVDLHTLFKHNIFGTKTPIKFFEDLYKDNGLIL